MPTPDTFVDGCGTISDEVIGSGTRIRFKLDEDRNRDISVFVQDGVLHIIGQYLPLIVSPVERNYVEVNTKPLVEEEHHCRNCECIHETCGYVIGSMGCMEFHERNG